MQLGTRWQVNTSAPQNLDELVTEAVAQIEKELAVLDQNTVSWFWTLTYLENRPVVQLDDGTTIRLSSDSTVSVQQED